MDSNSIRQRLFAAYLQNSPASRWEHAERLATDALRLAKENSVDVGDVDLVQTMACLLPLRDAITTQVQLRSSVEGFLVEHGWTPLRIRELIRSLERLPDRPKTDEEKIVADAHTLSLLGMRGFVRQLILGAEEVNSPKDLLPALRRACSRKLFTRAAVQQAQHLRERLRALAQEMDDGF